MMSTSWRLAHPWDQPCWQQCIHACMWSLRHMQNDGRRLAGAPLRSALLAMTSVGTGSAPGLAAACGSPLRATKLPRAATSFAHRRTLGCALCP